MKHSGHWFCKKLTSRHLCRNPSSFSIPSLHKFPSLLRSHSFEPFWNFNSLWNKPLKAHFYNCWHWKIPEAARRLFVTPESFADAPKGAEVGRAVFHFGHRLKCDSPGAINDAGAFSDWSDNNNSSRRKHERIPVKDWPRPSSLREPPLVLLIAERRVCRILSSHRGSFFSPAYQQWGITIRQNVGHAQRSRRSLLKPACHVPPS